jgi:hypothetical protein
MVRTVPDAIADPEEETAADFLVVNGGARDLSRRSHDGRSGAVDHRRRPEKLLHVRMT